VVERLRKEVQAAHLQLLALHLLRFLQLAAVAVVVVAPPLQRALMEALAVVVVEAVP
jgi:hypothetical protein